MTVTSLVLLGMALLLVAWLSAAATAVRSVSRIWLRQWVEQQLSGGAAADTYLERLHGLLVAASGGVALLVTLTGTLLGSIPDLDVAGLAGSILLATVVVMVFGQILPRAIARRWASQLIPILLPPLRLTAVFIAPVERAAVRVARALATPSPTADTEVQHEGIEDLLREGELEGISEPDELDIISGVVQFGEKVLRDVMTPRTDVFALDISLPPMTFAHEIAKAGYSRVPVYRNSIDEIVGMVHVFDVLREGGELFPHVRPVAHAPETKRCSEMLFEMLRAQRHLAVVLDEFGGTAGIVTLEDVLEELVGDIRDEHDEPMTETHAVLRRAMVLEASTPLESVAEKFGIPFPPEIQERAQSLGGAVVRLLGRIPQVGERFLLGDLELTVVTAQPARLEQLLVQPAAGASTATLTPPR